MTTIVDMMTEMIDPMSRSIVVLGFNPPRRKRRHRQNSGQSAKTR